MDGVKTSGDIEPDARWRARLRIAFFVPLILGVVVSVILFYRDTGDTPVLYATLWIPDKNTPNAPAARLEPTVYFEVNDDLLNFFGSSRLNAEDIPFDAILVLSNISGLSACKPSRDADVTVSRIPSEWGRRHSNYKNRLFAIILKRKLANSRETDTTASVVCDSSLRPQHSAFTNREIAFNGLSEIWSVSKPELPLPPHSHEMGIQRFGVVLKAQPASFSFRGRGRDVEYPGVDSLRVRVHEVPPRDSKLDLDPNEWESRAADSGRLRATWEPSGLAEFRDLLLLIAGALFSLAASAGLELVKLVR